MRLSEPALLYSDLCWWAVAPPAMSRLVLFASLTHRPITSAIKKENHTRGRSPKPNEWGYGSGGEANPRGNAESILEEVGTEMPILSDAREEAGRADAEILSSNQSSSEPLLGWRELTSSSGRSDVAKQSGGGTEFRPLRPGGQVSCRAEWLSA